MEVEASEQNHDLCGAVLGMQQSSLVCSAGQLSLSALSGVQLL